MSDHGTAELRAVLEHATRSAPAVSAWSVGMHVHHCALATIGMCRALAESAPPPPPDRFSWARAFVLLTGRIPRGRGKAPASVIPREDVSPERLAALLDEADRVLAEARALDAGTWFRHFVFGVLHRDRTLRFILVHNRHHRRIVDDILAA